MGAESTTYLSLRELVKSYDGRVNAIDGISLDVRKGEFITLLGPSGSGKTTTLMTVAGFEELTAGDILLDGRSLTNIQPHKRNIGIVFQNYALFPHMTVARNIAYPLKMRRVPKVGADKKVVAVLELVGLSEFRERYPRELSGGQQQRVALARALVFEPDLLLLDEPLGALDKNLREQMQVEVKRIHEEVGVTMIYVTHDQTEAMTMSDRIAVFNDGRIEQVAAPLDMYLRPATFFVGDFIGDSNFVDGRVSESPRGGIEVAGLGVLKGPLDIDEGIGPDVHLLIRPENIHDLNGTESDDMNAFDMTVESSINYGDNVLIVGKVVDRTLRMRSPGTRFSTLRKGDRLRVGWHCNDSHVISRSSVHED